MALRIVRGRGWHCAFTRGCVYESLGPGFRQPGTNQVFCSTHRTVVESSMYAGGRDGGTSMAQVNMAQLRRTTRGGQR